MEQTQHWCAQVLVYLDRRIEQARYYRATDTAEELAAMKRLVLQLEQLSAKGKPAAPAPEDNAD